MKIINHIVFILSLTLFSTMAQAEPIRLNLDECVERALLNNEDIKGAQYDIYGSIAKKIEATKRYVPVVNYKYRFAPVPQDLNDPVDSLFGGDISVFNSIKIEAGVPLTTFGKITVSNELANIGIDASRLQKVRKSDEVALDIYKLYYGIVLARESKQLADKGLQAVQDKITELEKAETPDQLQILKLKAIIYQIDKKLDEANKKELIAIAMLKYHMGLEDDVDFDIRDKSLKSENYRARSYEDLVQESKAKRPEFTLLNYQVDAKQKQLTLEKKNYLPKLVAGTFFEYGDSPGIVGDESQNDFTNPFNFLRAGVGLELSGELDFRKIKANVELAKAELGKAIAEKRSKHRLLEIDLKNAYLELEQRQKLLNRSEREQKSARQIVFLTKSNVDIGIGEKKDYLEALQSYLLIQAAHLENIYNYNVAVATVKNKVGSLYENPDMTK